MFNSLRLALAKKVTLAAFSLLCNIIASGQARVADITASINSDTAQNNITTTFSGYQRNSNNVLLKVAELRDATMQEDLQARISKVTERKELMKHLRQLNVAGIGDANRSNRKLFYNLANVFARLKMYSLAMKCFLKTQQYTALDNYLTQPNAYLKRVDSAGYANSLTDSIDINDGYLDFSTRDDSVIIMQTQLLSPPDKERRSPKITYYQIAATFNDGKKAVAYAMMIHVKQPVPGKRKVHVLANSGHTFITLIKYNRDSSYVSLSFGFYPDKNHPMAGTPLFPSASSSYRDDGDHKWDEVAGKFISKKRFDKILELTRNYNGIKYHLSKNNCTDFSLNAAALANINIKETTGSWPLGHGNNPGITGQSLLLGNVSDGDSDGLENIFIEHNPAVKPAP